MRGRAFRARVAPPPMPRCHARRVACGATHGGKRRLDKHGVAGEAAASFLRRNPFTKSTDLVVDDFAVINFQPGQGCTFTHSHRTHEEIYLCVQGRGRILLDDELIELEPGELVHVAPEIRRSLYADPLTKTGYSLKSEPENFVVYVIGGVKAHPDGASDGAQNPRQLKWRGVPHFDDVPPWYRGDARVIARNAALRERFQSWRARSVDLEAAEAKVNGAASREGAVASAPSLVTLAVLVDADRKKILLTQSDAGGPQELPGGRVLAGETPEESLSRHLKDRLGVEAHPETFESFTFKSGLGDRDDLLLIYSCSDFHGEPKCQDDGGSVTWLSCAQLKHADTSPAIRHALPMIKAKLKRAASQNVKNEL